MTKQVSRKERRLETWSAILMSLATVATAWCAYQSAEWGGEQSFMLGESNRAGREATLQESLAMQRRSLDAALFMEWIGAIATENQPLEDFYFQRFRPGMRIAVDAWLETDPKNNLDAPPHPFVLPEYRIEQDSIASSEREKSETSWALAREYDAHGDRYVLLTVVFASVLFFAGISEKFEEDRVRIGVLLMGTVLFTGAFAVMMSYPVWW
ncbi:MAG: hypothetical protein M8860_12030 [marine benthic group bacterium]|nr:hypothetical protein [Candidatus Carthagonibacter metallireducens]MCL7965678.1 hypothetical protein [Gemmatimonadota bacterium]MCL7977742.1 hypothetical protein [Gemmatimonadota bacterium]MCL7982716.1 hypothetical protein [Gemmatimonadota bacterium]MCL7985860.1 hypothetical protein [Gemmatimonadota bacterium]